MLCSSHKIDLETCPFDRKPNPEFVNPPKMVTNMLDRMKVICLGCGSSTSRENFHQHIENLCPIPCPNQCKQQLTRNSYSAHFDLCMLEIISCGGSVVGCDYIGTREDVLIHQNACLKYVSKDLLKEIEKLKNEFTLMSNSFQQKERQLVLNMTNQFNDLVNSHQREIEEIKNNHQQELLNTNNYWKQEQERERLKRAKEKEHRDRVKRQRQLQNLHERRQREKQDQEREEREQEERENQERQRLERERLERERFERERLERETPKVKFCFRCRLYVQTASHYCVFCLQFY
jgi:hypothetical protein